MVYVVNSKIKYNICQSCIKKYISIIFKRASKKRLFVKNYRIKRISVRIYNFKSMYGGLRIAYYHLTINYNLFNLIGGHDRLRQ